MLTPHARGLTFWVRLRPGARADRIDEPRCLEDGRVALAVRVTAAPEKGRANQALIRLLARSWGLPKSSFSVLAGARERRKLVLIEGDPDEIRALLSQCCPSLSRGKS